MNDLNNSIDISNTINTITNQSRVDEIAYNTSVIADGMMFLVAFIVVLVVCYILWKSLENFISY